MRWLHSRTRIEDGTWLYLFGVRIWRRRFIMTWNLS